MPEFPCTGPIDATIRVPAGILHVSAEERSTVLVTVEPAKNREHDRAAAEATRVEMLGDSLLIEVPNARGVSFRRSPELRVQVRLPLDSNLDIKSASCDTILEGRVGSVRLDSASGDARIEHVSGDLNRFSASGDSTIVRVDGSVNINKASGDIHLAHVGGGLTAKSASGDIETGVIDGPVKMHTASGDIRVGTLIRGEARLNAASGDIEIGVAEGTSVWLDLSSASGDTTTDLAMSGDVPTGGTATLSLYVRTASGDISVRRAPRPAWVFDEPVGQVDDLLVDPIDSLAD